ncbi:MAG TPA: DNA translocase FtsK 4TM domain-containing protein [Alphaproteobacteria bacterium]|nr:DNA translocase FtsK 4TM domain-containing protein [Alphaproteobacteria bacterium]
MQGVSIAQPRALMPEGMKQFLRDNLIRLGGVLALGCAGFVTLALISHSGADPSLNNIASAPVVNRAGLAGAYIADFLWQWLGLLSIMLPACLAVWGLRIVWELRLPLWRWRPLGLIWGLPFGALALGSLPAPSIWTLRVGLGGALGDGLMGLALGLIAKLPFSLTALQAMPGLFIGGVAALVALPALLFALAITPGQWRGVAAHISALFRAASHALGLARTGLQRLNRRPAARPITRYGLDLDRAPPLRRKSAGAARSADENEPLPHAPARKPQPRVAREQPARESKSKRANAADQTALDLGRVGEYQLPPLSLLRTPPAGKSREGGLDQAESDESLEQNARMLETVLQDFGIRGEILNVRPGPVVTLYELEPAPGIKSARVIGLADDIARSMSAVSARVAVIPGRNAIGIELPNSRRETVYLRTLLSSRAYESTSARLTLALGKTIGGEPVIADLAAMPHLLIAGTTGSGKSVGINTMILSLLYRLPPDQCKFIMIDPKMLELSMYDGIPHLLTPVVTEPGKAVVALKWAVREMEDRYRKMSRLGVRSIAAYNQRVAQADEKNEILKRTVQTGFDPGSGQPIFEEQEMDLAALPFIVIIVDEMADLMMVAGKDIEGAVQRLAQMARAAGIHLIMATQRPSVDVITGTIKANFPTRISFQVTSKIDSRTILGEQGAEQLLGQGDMLFMAGGGRVTRVHGPYVGDDEVERAVSFLKSQGRPEYLDAVTADEQETEITDDMMGMAGGDSDSALYDQAVAMVARQGRASTSLVQRHLRIGYNRAARIIEEMEAQGVISAPNHSGKREVLIGDR